MRQVFIIGCLLLSAASAYYGQPYVRDNSDAILVIITVMTVFAGFLVAIITILGDPSLLPEGTWRTAEVRRENLVNRLTTHLWLFVFYLITIGLLFVGALLSKAPEKVIAVEWKIWIERAYMFFGTASFLFTFGLPRALWKFQIARIDSEIERRRRRAGLKD